MSGAVTRRNFLSFDFGNRARGITDPRPSDRNGLPIRNHALVEDAGHVAAARAALDEADELIRG